MVESYIGMKVPPADVVMPATAQDVMTAIVGAVVGLALLWGLKRSFRDADHRLLVCVLAGFTAVALEAFALYLIKGSYPAVGIYALYQGFGKSIPVFMGLAYSAFFGLSTYIFLLQAKEGLSAAAYWTNYAVIVIAAAAVELVGINLGLWFYYDDQPFVVAGFPLAYAFENTCLAMIFAATARTWFSRVRGAAQYGFVLLAPFIAIGAYAALAWPVAFTLYSGNGTAVNSVGALVSVGAGLILSRMYVRQAVQK